MIVTKLKGGLGNQMFQYVVGLAIASQKKEVLKIDVTGYDDVRYINADTPRTYRLFPFNLSGVVATKEEALKSRNPLGILSKVLRACNQKVFKKNYVDYDASFFKNSPKYIEGYFQSEKNFMEVKDVVRGEFTLKKEYESGIFLEEKNKIDSTKSVSVHIRRGDYVNDSKTNSFHGTCSKEYYEKAMNIVKEKVDSPLFYFFSDDIEWVKKEFGEADTFVFISNPKLEDYEELLLMSYCSHNIIANSSFSWWGAWLNKNPDKIVIAPKKWVTIEPNPQPNIIPESWITI
jgi:hypothetical protein